MKLILLFALCVGGAFEIQNGFSKRDTCNNVTTYATGTARESNCTIDLAPLDVPCTVHGFASSSTWCLNSLDDLPFSHIRHSVYTNTNCSGTPTLYYIITIGTCLNRMKINMINSTSFEKIKFERNSCEGDSYASEMILAQCMHQENSEFSNIYSYHA